MNEKDLARREYTLLLDEYGEVEVLEDVVKDVRQRRQGLSRD